MESVIGMSRRGHPALPKVVSQQRTASAGVQATVFSCSFVSCRLPACLPAARRTRKALGPWLITTDVAGWQQGRQVAWYLCWQGQISVPFLVRDAGFELDVSAVRSRGRLYCTISASVRGIVANDGHHRIVKGPGLASWLVISLLRRMCFRRRD